MNKTIKTTYGYRVTFEGDHDIIVENEDNQITAAFTPDDLIYMAYQAEKAIEKELFNREN